MSYCYFCNKHIRRESPSEHSCEACRTSREKDSLWLRQLSSGVWQLSIHNDFDDQSLEGATATRVIEVTCTRADKAQFREIDQSILSDRRYNYLSVSFLDTILPTLLLTSVQTNEDR